MGVCLSQTEKFAVHELKDVVIPIIREELVPVIIEDVKRELQKSVKYLPSSDTDTPQ